MMDKERRKFTVVLLPVGQEYQAFFPHYPGCVTLGATPAEALAMAKEAIELHLEGEAALDLASVVEGSHADHVVVGEIEVEVPRILIERERQWELGRA